MEENREEVVFEDVSMSDDNDEDDSDSDNSENKDIYLPGKPLKDGEELICDDSAYVMLHQAQTGAPCLSFDICANKLDEVQNSYPMHATIVAGTQAAKAHVNK